MGEERASETQEPPDSDNKTALEVEKLSIERERLELEKKKFAFDQRFMNRNLGTVLSVAVSLAAVFVSFTQIHINSTTQRAETDRLSRQHDFDLNFEQQKQETEWRVRAGDFAAAHLTELFSSDQEVQQRSISLLKVTFQQNAAGVLAVVAESAQNGKQKSGLIAAATSEFSKKAVPAAGSNVWLSAPASPNAQSYMYMSRLLQVSLRKKLYDSYFNDVSHYVPNEACAALLVYAALPVTTSVNFVGDGRLIFNTDKDTYWDFVDVSLRNAIIENVGTVEALTALLQAAHVKLTEANSSNAAFFAPSEAPRFLVLARSATGDTFLQSLLFFEAATIRYATDTGVKIAGLKARGQAVDIQKELDNLQHNVLRVYEQSYSGVYSGKDDVVKNVLLSDDFRRVLLEPTKVF